MTSESAPHADQRVLVVAPIGRDASLTCEVFERAGLHGEGVPHLEALCDALAEGAGVVVIAEEALAHPSLARLECALAAQPAWSDLPVVVLGSALSLVSRPRRGYERLGNVTLVERPVSVRELVAVVRSALRNRIRQYAARREIEHRDQFLAMLAHELRNPLGAVSLATETLRRKAEDPTLRDHMIEVLQRQSSSLKRLVDELLDVARVTSGKISLQCENVDVTALVRRVYETFAPRFRDAGIEAELRGGPALWTSGDAVRLEQVVSNLLGNALKFTPSGRRVTVELAATDGRVVVSVADTGLGISAEMLPRIFDMFAQAPPTLARTRGGLGLGLTLVRSIVQLHGGEVAVESEGLDHGARFSVSLPRIAAPAQAGALAQPESMSTTSARKILIVEDNPDAGAALQKLLEADGHRVEWVANGREGLERLVAMQPEVALLDIGLPDLDGYEIARRTRAALGAAPLLVALTGYGQAQDRRDALDAGFDHHMTKPVDLDALRSLLRGQVRTAA